MARTERQSLTPAELIKVLKAARDHSVRDWALLLVTYKHGLRASEAAKLRLQDITREGQIVVNRVKGSLRTVQDIIPHRGKPLLDEKKALDSWLKVRVPDGSDALFTSRKGGFLVREQVYRIFKQHAQTAGLPESKQFVHALKHTRASHLVAANMPIMMVKQALGHKSLSSTAVYAHVTDRQAGEAARQAEMRLF